MGIDLLVEDWQRVLTAERSRRYRLRKAAARQEVKDNEFRRTHRDHGFSFDGRYEGPGQVGETRELKPYRAMPIDVHVNPIAPKFNIVTPEDVDWSERQGTYKKPMLKPHTNWCPGCVAYVEQNHEHPA